MGCRENFMSNTDGSFGKFICMHKIGTGQLGSLRLGLRGGVCNTTGPSAAEPHHLDAHEAYPVFVGNTMQLEYEQGQSEREERTDSENQGALSIDLHAVVQMTREHECLKFQAGEYRLHETVEIDRCLGVSYTAPALDANAVSEALTAATGNISTASVAATTVVRIWGFWSFLNATSGNVSNITTIANAREANYPTLDILGGPWSFTFCGLRSVIGTAVLVYANGHANILRCSVGSLPGFPKAGYGVTGTDTSSVVMRETVVQRCRHAGARFVRHARAELIDCVFEKCILQGAKNEWSKRPLGA